MIRKLALAHGVLLCTIQNVRKFAEIFASQGAPPVSTTNCRRYQRHRRQICHRFQQHRRQNFATSFASVVDTGGKFFTGVNDTGGKFATGVNDTGGKL